MSAGRKNSRDALTEEDRILWYRVASSATPLAGRRLEPPGQPPAKPAGETEPAPALTVSTATLPRTSTQPTRPASAGFDAPIRRKLEKGRLPIEARVDLHGLTQEEAHGLLLDFVLRAHAAGLRNLLVITGKGRARGGQGVLRRMVPEWLATGPFRLHVGAFEEAGDRHGGGGALYVRLRAPRRPGR